ncbi:Pleiotropic drug resistance protein 2 [Sesamum angolense]|uniref:Pleiotropic drug resistance protein 2 n=1 Tax=Sesamum angolense TaxID=2727404 RepID=A0AAE2C4S2_9LAMI|nr:Pleiotropic drug resistance protein 2 [Sesamum angolense]
MLWEWLLMKRSSFIYIFKTTQITIMATIALTVFLRTEMKSGRIEDASKFWGALFFSLINVMFNGMQELAMTVFRLPVFFKQRDCLFYPAWAFALPNLGFSAFQYFSLYACLSVCVCAPFFSPCGFKRRI